MKNTIYIVVMFLACFVMACTDDKTEDFNGPYSLIVTGPATAVPGTTKTYLLAPYTNPESYTWTIEGPATIVGATTGASVKVSFTSPGAVTLRVSNQAGDKAMVPITVNKVTPAVTVSLNRFGALHNGQKDTVFLTFASALETTPVINQLAASDSSHFHKKKKAFNSGLLESLQKLDAKHYYALYTAGSGDGTPEALIKGSVATADYGGGKVDSIYVELYEVDNTAPMADLTYSTTNANKGTVVTITATFSEPVTFQNPLDSAIRVSVSGAGVTNHIDTLKLVSEDDPLVYTYKYKLTGMGNGNLDVEILNTVDLANNDLDVVTNSGGILTVDNSGPSTLGVPTDAGNVASIAVTSSETGTASYLILDSGDDAPTDADSFFGADAVDSGSLSVSAGKQVEVTKPIGTGSYDVYFISVDEAGNYGAISTATLVMN